MSADQTHEEVNLGGMVFAIICGLLFLWLGYWMIDYGEDFMYDFAADTVTINEESESEKSNQSMEQLLVLGNSAVEIGYDLDGTQSFNGDNILEIQINDVSEYPFIATLTGILGTCNELENSIVEMIEIGMINPMALVPYMEDFEEKHAEVFFVELRIDDKSDIGDLSYSERLEHQDAPFGDGMLFNDYCVLYENQQGKADSVIISTHMTDDSPATKTFVGAGYIIVLISIIVIVSYGFLIYSSKEEISTQIDSVRTQQQNSQEQILSELKSQIAGLEATDSKKTRPLIKQEPYYGTLNKNEWRRVEKEEWSSVTKPSSDDDVVVSKEYECRTCHKRFASKNKLFDHLELNLDHKKGKDVLTKPLWSLNQPVENPVNQPLSDETPITPIISPDGYWQYVDNKWVPSTAPSNNLESVEENRIPKMIDLD